MWCLLLARLHIVWGGETSDGRWRLSSSSVTLHGRPAGGFTRAGRAMTSCRLPSNYSSTVALQSLHGGPVVLRPVGATPCFHLISLFMQRNEKSSSSSTWIRSTQCIVKCSAASVKQGVDGTLHYWPALACCPLMSYVAYASVKDDERRQTTRR